MRRSLTRIRASHVGRLPPPRGWADMPARLAGAEITDPVVIAAKVMPAIAETVKKQIEAGIDCIGDTVHVWADLIAFALYEALTAGGEGR
jgi:methionine synthase II (cobalamin-independent)